MIYQAEIVYLFMCLNFLIVSIIKIWIDITEMRYTTADTVTEYQIE